MHAVLEDITQGQGKEEDIEFIEDLAWTISNGSLCQLGATAANPVLTTLKYFRGEYEAHIRDKRCPAGVCKALITYWIDAKKCTGCGVCFKQCPENAITGKLKKAHKIDESKCIKCGICRDVCRFDAVIFA
jgi:NADH-quinone oxidoreductase subunit F